MCVRGDQSVPSGSLTPCHLSHLTTSALSPNSQRTTGSFHVILQKHSFSDAVLVAEKRAVTEGILTDEEFKSILTQFKPLITDVEARNRCKRCSIVPTSIVVAACAAYGRCQQTIALMKALEQLPRLWQLQIEQVRLLLLSHTAFFHRLHLLRHVYPLSLPHRSNRVLDSSGIPDWTRTSLQRRRARLSTWRQSLP